MRIGIFDRMIHVATLGPPVLANDLTSRPGHQTFAPLRTIAFGAFLPSMSPRECSEWPIALGQCARKTARTVISPPLEKFPPWQTQTRAVVISS